MKGAIDGAREISTPIIFAVLTSVAAFLPMLFVPGPMGKIFQVIPLIVIPCLLFSLVESLAILPAHLSHLSPPRRPGPWRRFQSLFTRGLFWVIQRVYRPSLEAAIRWRYLTVAAGFALLILTVGMVLGGYTTFVFFPSDRGRLHVGVTDPPSRCHRRGDLTGRGAHRGRGARLRREVLEETGRDGFATALASVGSQPMSSRMQQGPMGGIVSTGASNLGEVTIELVPAEERTITSEALGNRWRELTGPIPEAVDVSFNATIMNAGEDVNVQLVGPDVDVLRAAAGAVRLRLAEFAGVVRD